MKVSSYLNPVLDITYTSYIPAVRLWLHFPRVQDIFNELLFKESLQGTAFQVNLELAHFMSSNLMGMSEMEIGLRIFGAWYALNRKVVPLDLLVFILGVFHKYACETFNSLKKFLTTVFDLVHELGELLGTKIKTTMGFQQTLGNFLLMHFRLFFNLFQRLDADKQATVNNRRVDRVVAQLREVCFQDSAPLKKGWMATDVTYNYIKEVEVFDVDNLEVCFRRGSRKRCQPYSRNRENRRRLWKINRPTRKPSGWKFRRLHKRR